LRIVLVDDLDRQAADLAPEVIEAELECIAHVVANRRSRPAKRADEADFDRLLLRPRLLSRARRRGQSKRGCGNNSSPDHRVHPSRLPHS